jgi:predicted dehydrogenase
LTIRFGVIGVGHHGKHHERIYSELESELENIELTVVVDIVKETADKIAEKYGCKAYYDYKHMLNEVDAVSIVTPTATHHSIALDCLKAGKDILVEKPITENIREADELINEAEKRGCILQVGHLERYNPAMLAASEMIENPLFIESERFSPFLGRGGRGTDIDVTLDLMIHDVDIILSLIPLPLKEIRAVGAKVLTDKIDVAKAWLSFENGCIALATVSRLSPEKQRRLKVFQKDSYISIDYMRSEIKRHFRTDEGIISSDIIRPENKEPLKEELKDFIDCIKTRKRPKVSGVEGRNALKVVLEISEIIKRQQ